MEKSVSTTGAQQSDSQNRQVGLISPLEVEQINAIASEYSYPDRMGMILNHPAPMIKNISSRALKPYMCVQLSKSIKALYNVDGPNEEGYQILSEMLIENFGSMRLFEIKRVIRLSAKGVNYNRIDVQVIYKWFEDYWKDRREAMRSEKRRRDQEDYERSRKQMTPPSPEYMEEFKKKTQKLIDGLGPKYRRYKAKNRIDQRSESEKRQDAGNMRRILESSIEEE